MTVSYQFYLAVMKVYSLSIIWGRHHGRSQKTPRTVQIESTLKNSKFTNLKSHSQMGIYGEKILMGKCAQSERHTEAEDCKGTLDLSPVPIGSASGTDTH